MTGQDSVTFEIKKLGYTTEIQIPFEYSSNSEEPDFETPHKMVIMAETIKAFSRALDEKISTSPYLIENLVPDHLKTQTYSSAGDCFQDFRP